MRNANGSLKTSGASRTWCAARRAATRHAVREARPSLTRSSSRRDSHVTGRPWASAARRPRAEGARAHHDPQGPESEPAGLKSRRRKDDRNGRTESGLREGALLAALGERDGGPPARPDQRDEPLLAVHV